MPEINQEPKKSAYWGNSKYSEIEDKKYLNVSLDVVNSVDLTQRLSEENIKFSARNNEELSTASLIVNKGDYDKVSEIIRNAVTNLIPNVDLQDKSWGNVKYADIEKRAFINIGSNAAAKINIGKLLNENQIQFSARENASVQVTSLVINKADEEKVKGIIKNALAPTIEQSSQTIPKQQHSKITVSSDMRAEIGKQLFDKNIDFSSSVNEQNRIASFTVNTNDLPKLNEILKSISHSQTQENQTQENKTQENQPQKNENPIDKTISVSDDIKLKVAKELMDNDIAFSTHSNGNNTEFTLVNDNDIEKADKILQNIGKEDKTQENSVTDNSISNNQNVVAEEITSSQKTVQSMETPTIPNEDNKEFVPVEPTPLDTTINALKQSAERNGIDLSKKSQSAIARAVDLLERIQDNSFTANEPIKNIAKQDVPLDFGEKITPVLKMSVNNHENTLKRLAEKNDTISSKINKNENRNEALKSEVESLKHNNSLLTAMKKIPVVSVVASAMIEQNNKRIENIINVKIPQREQKIEKHTTKLEKNNIKIDKVMGKLKELSTINKFITNFKTMNIDERRQGFIDGLTAITQNSLNRVQTKQNKAISQLQEIADNVNSGNIPIIQLSSQMGKISKLLDTIEQQQGKLQQSNILLENLVKVANGELLQEKEKLDTIMDNTEKAVALAVADTVDKVEKDTIQVDNISDTISDSVVEAASGVVEQAVSSELETNQKETNIYENNDIQQEAENTSSQIIVGILEEVASLCNVDVNSLLQLPMKTQDNIAEIYNNNLTDYGLLNAEMIQEVVLGVIEKNEPHLYENVDIKNSSDTILDREERPVNPEPVVTENKEQKILTELASVTGFTVSQLNSLPKDIKTDIIAEYEVNGGKIDTDSFAKNIADILHVDVPKVEQTIPSNVNIQTESKEKDNPLKTVEELIEGNANSIDGVINNLPPEKDNQEHNQSKDKPVKSVPQEQPRKNFRFSVNDLFSSRYASRTTKEQQEQNNDRKKSNEWGL